MSLFKLAVSSYLVSALQGGPRLKPVCRNLIWWLPVLVAGCSGGLKPEQLRHFQAVEERFQQATSPADYALVADEYQQIIDSGLRSGAVFFNQGNAYSKAGQPARAIAAYRQAQRYLPGDPHLAASLNRVVDRATAQRTVWSYVFFWQDWISYPGKFYLTTLIGAVAFVLGLLHVVDRRMQWARRGALISVLVACAVGASAAYDWYRFDKHQHGVVVAEVTARKGNGRNYEPAFTKPLFDGTEFTVLEQRNDWILVRLADANEGWLPVESVVVY